MPKLTCVRFPKKARYGDRATAKKAVKAVSGKHGGRRQIVSVYHCQPCGGWHLSSMSKS